MSTHFLTKEEAINELYTTIKSKFEEDGVLREVRSMLQSKMVAMMQGKSVTSSLLQRPPSCGDNDTSRDAHIALLNQLLFEYLHWHNFQYTAEMLSMECGSDNTKPQRESLEGALGTFQHKDLPVLLEVVAKLMTEQKNKNSPV